VRGVILLMTSPIDLPVSLRRGPHFTLAVLLAALFVAGGAGAAEQNERLFNLAADTAAKALRRFTEQSGIPVLFGTETAAQVRTNAVQGAFTPTEAMARLLADTGLVVTANEKTGALTVSRDANVQRAVATNSRPNAPSGANVRPAASASETITLSPFTVSTDKDNGYAATETLAGTRMRTNLRDVGASLTILTPEFLQDLAATNPQEALIYTPSIDTVSGDPSRGAGDFLSFSNGQTYSVRGFVTNNGDQDSSRNFFTSFVPSDAYNIERVSLTRGPNAILFGVGGPQGVAEMSTKRASPGRRSTQVQLRVDRWGSRRASFDHNQPLLANRLALRLNSLLDDRREFRDHEGGTQQRVTLGGVYLPTANTKLTVNVERYRNERTVVPLLWGFDNGAMQWIMKGRPTVGFLPQGAAWAGSRAYVDTSGRSVPVFSGVVDADGFVDAKADFDPLNAIGQKTAQSPTYVTGLGLANPVLNLRYQGQLQSNRFDGSTLTKSITVDPWKLFGIATTTNLMGGSRDDPEQQEKGTWSQVFVEQRLTRDLHVELAANWARHDKDFWPDKFNIISIDPNRYLPDGSLNPGYLQPYADNANQFRQVRSRSAEYRATLSYESDFRKLHRWLGRHNFSLLGQSGRTTTDQDVMRYYNRASVGQAGWSANAVGGDQYLQARTYFVGGLPSYPLPDGWQMTRNLAQINAQRTMVGIGAQAAPLDYALRPFTTAPKTRTEINSYSFAWQGRWWQERLVTTFGIKKDETQSFGAGSSRNWADPAIAGSSTNELLRYFDLSRDVAFDPTPLASTVGTSRTQGAVYHVNSWLAATYNRSNNFTPVANASSITLLGEPARSQLGETVDYGVRASLHGGRLSISLNHFANSVTNQGRGGGAYTGAIRGILTRLRTNYKDARDSHFTAMRDQGGYPAEAGVVTDWNFDATGYEASIIFNPNRHWRLSLSGSKNENVLGAHLTGMGDYLALAQPYEGLATWRRFASELAKVAAGQASAQFDLNPANPAHQAQAAADAAYLNDQTNAVERLYLDERAAEGQSTNWNGKYSANGVGTYTFGNEGLFKGWAIGGNFRWRSRNILGYERLRDAVGVPEGIIDVTRTIMGKEFWELGAMLSYTRAVRAGMNLRLQLNLQNLFDWDDVRPVGVGTDTDGIMGVKYASVVNLYEIRRPRNLIFSATLDF
jgi:hypothetical protein